MTEPRHGKQPIVIDETPGKKVAGVTAGASTPEWVIAEFVRNLEAN